MKKQSNKLDNSIREAIEQIDVSADNLLWQNIDKTWQNSLDKKKNKRKIVIAFFLGLLVPITFLMLNQKAKQSINPKVVIENSIDKSNLNNIDLILKRNQKQLRIKDSLVPNSIKKERKISLKNTLYAHENKVNTNTSNSILANVNEDTKQVLPILELGPFSRSLKPIKNSLALESFQKVYLEQTPKILPPKISNLGSLYAYVSFGFNRGNLTIDQPFEEGKMHKDLPLLNANQSNSMNGYFYKVVLEYRIGKNLYTNFGFSKSNLSFNKNFSYTFNQIPVRDSASKQILGYITLPNNLAKEVNIKEKQFINTISFPFALGYSNFLVKNWVYELGMEGQFTKVSKTNFTYFSIENGNVQPVITSNEIQNFNFQSQISLGIFKAILPKTKVGVELRKQVYSQKYSSNQINPSRTQINFIIKQQLK